MNNQMNYVKAVLTAIPIIALASCASIISKSQYPVSITSHPEGAIFSVVDRNNQLVHQGRTPETVTLASSAGFAKPARYSITFDEPEYEPSPHQLSSSIDGWYFGNVVLGGFIGMLVVDPITGAMWRLPKSISTDLVEKHGEADSQGNNLT